MHTQGKIAFFFSVLAMFLVFLADLLLPLGVAVGVLYVLALLLAAGGAERRQFNAAAGLALALTLVALLLKLEADTSWMVYVNRVISLIAIFACAFLINRSHGQSVLLQEQLSLLHKTEQKLRSLFGATCDVIIVADSSGQILDWNNAGERVLGWSAEEMIGQSLTAIMPERFREAHQHGMRRFIDTGEAKLVGRPVELAAVAKSGEEIPIELSLGYWRQDSDTYFCAVIRDIQQRKSSDVALAAYAARLDIKNRELEQFAYAASHDLQEPLRTISSFVDLLEKKHGSRLDGEAREYMNFVLDASQRMKALIAALLDYSRLGRDPTLKQVNANTVVADVVADLGALIAEVNATIVIDDLPQFNAYETEIRVLFQNLIANAIKFRRENVRPRVRLSSWEERDKLVFSVQDNGIGIEERHRNKIFEMFKKLHPQSDYAGAGIGLAHCKKIVELHGGSIWVESKPGEGSIFYFTIPTALKREVNTDAPVELHLTGR